MSVLSFRSLIEQLASRDLHAGAVTIQRDLTDYGLDAGAALLYITGFCSTLTAQHQALSHDLLISN